MWTSAWQKHADSRSGWRRGLRPGEAGPPGVDQSETRRMVRRNIGEDKVDSLSQTLIRNQGREE